MRLPKPQSTLGRAVLPVLAGVAFFLVLGLATWIAAVFLSRNPDRVSERFAPSVLELGSYNARAEEVAENGPILLRDLNRPDGQRSIVVDHTGDVPGDAWRVRYAYPADRDPTCTLKQLKRTRQFEDCAGRVLEVDDLALPPLGVRPIIDHGDETISIDLRPAAPSDVTTTTTA